MSIYFSEYKHGNYAKKYIDYDSEEQHAAKQEAERGNLLVRVEKSKIQSL